MPERIGIVELFERVEAIKEKDPRSKGSVDDLISLWVDLEKVIREAGWSPFEYLAALSF